MKRFSATLFLLAFIGEAWAADQFEKNIQVKDKSKIVVSNPANSKSSCSMAKFKSTIKSNPNSLSGYFGKEPPSLLEG